MKYGILVCTPIKRRKNNNFINLGDMAQAEAIYNLYQEMDISEDDIIFIDLNDISQYNGEYVILPININLSLNWIIDIFPLPPHIIPVFLGLSFFTSEPFSASLKEYFINYAPIGCRDESTLTLMRENGIPSYLFGCITLTLPQRRLKNKANKIFMVDVPSNEIIPSLPEELLQNATIEEISHIYETTSDNMNVDDCLEQYRYLMERYKTEAKLIITSRLHCMAPCIAMGIPCIAYVENVSPRFEWIDHLIPIYTKDTINQIYWQVEPFEIGQLKYRMFKIAKERISYAFNMYSDIYDLSYYYENRQKSCYGDYYLSRFKMVPQEKNENLKYVIWGTGQIGINIYKIICKHYPKWELVAAIDSFCEGDFFGTKILKPEVLVSLENIYILVASYSGKKEIEKYLHFLNKEEYKDYLNLGTRNG